MAPICQTLNVCISENNRKVRNLQASKKPGSQEPPEGAKNAVLVSAFLASKNDEFFGSKDLTQSRY
jgi:hypothetical protein